MGGPWRVTSDLIRGRVVAILYDSLEDFHVSPVCLWGLTRQLFHLPFLCLWQGALKAILAPML